MKKEDINKANQIRQDLKELEYFAENINCCWGNTKMVVKRKCEVKYSVFGSRYFGWGTHEQEIKVPNKLIAHMDAAVVAWKADLELQLEEL